MAYTDKKTCIQCDELKAITDFYSQGKYRRSRCIDCTKADRQGEYARIPEDKKEQYARTRRAKRYGLSLEEHDRLFDGHEVCPICLTGDPGPRGWHIDHDHETDRVRGLLCQNCNLALGHFRDNIASMTRAQVYLEVNSGVQS